MRVKLAVAALASASALGCDADRIDGPTAEVSAPIPASAVQLAATRGAIADVATRVLPGSERLAASSELADAIGAVNRAMERGTATTLDQALTRAERAVSRLSRTGGVDGAELDAIRLALADGRRLLDPAPDP